MAMSIVGGISRLDLGGRRSLVRWVGMEVVGGEGRGLVLGLG